LDSEGRKTQTALIPEKYQRKEMESPISPKRTEQGVNFGLSFRNAIPLRRIFWKGVTTFKKSKGNRP